MESERESWREEFVRQAISWEASGDEAEEVEEAEVEGLELAELAGDEAAAALALDGEDCASSSTVTLAAELGVLVAAALLGAGETLPLPAVAVPVGAALPVAL